MVPLRALAGAANRLAQSRLRIHHLIRQGLPGGEPLRAEIAALLGMSERTLHRRLTTEGTSFRFIVDETRRDLAQLYVGDPPAAAYFCSPNRRGEHPESFLGDFAGILQADAFSGLGRLYVPAAIAPQRCTR